MFFYLTMLAGVDSADGVCALAAAGVDHGEPVRQALGGQGGQLGPGLVLEAVEDLGGGGGERGGAGDGERVEVQAELKIPFLDG